LKKVNFEMDLMSSHVKEFQPSHVTNFPELGFKVGPSLIFYFELEPYVSNSNSIQRSKPCKTVVLDHSWNRTFILNKRGTHLETQALGS
jgi:hypothetical protein